MSEPTKEKMRGWLSEVVANYLDHCLAENIRPCQEAERAILALIEHGPEVDRPTIVCLCGSTRFTDAFRRASLEETLGGKIVLSIGCDLRDSGFETFTQEHLAEIKVELDELHLRKIDLADEVFILNVGGYIGKSTRNELNYAKEKGKRIRFLELPDVYPTLR